MGLVPLSLFRGGLNFLIIRKKNMVFKISTDNGFDEFSIGAADKKANLQSVHVEDAATIEQFPMSEQDINQIAIGEGLSGEENG